MFDRQNTLAKTDPQLWAAIQNENKRQEDHIELIASENYTSPAVMKQQTYNPIAEHLLTKQCFWLS